MVNYANPSILFLWIPDRNLVLETLTTLDEVIGYYDDNGTDRDLYARNIGDVETVDFDGESISNLQRGTIRFERKFTIKEDPSYDIVRPFKPNYYIFTETRRNRTLLLIIGDKGIQTYLHRLLLSLGVDVQTVDLGRRVQEQLLRRRDIRCYGIQTEDDSDPRIKKVRAVGPSGLVDIRGSAPERFVDGRGQMRDQGLTWEGNASRPQITYWITHYGAIYARNPQLNEEYLLELVDLIVTYL